MTLRPRRLNCSDPRQTRRSAGAASRSSGGGARAKLLRPLGSRAFAFGGQGCAAWAGEVNVARRSSENHCDLSVAVLLALVAPRPAMVAKATSTPKGRAFPG